MCVCVKCFNTWYLYWWLIIPYQLVCKATFELSKLIFKVFKKRSAALNVSWAKSQETRHTFSYWHSDRNTYYQLECLAVRRMAILRACLRSCPFLTGSRRPGVRLMKIWRLAGGHQSGWGGSCLLLCSCLYTVRVKFWWWHQSWRRFCRYSLYNWSQVSATVPPGSILAVTLIHYVFVIRLIHNIM